MSVNVYGTTLAYGSIAASLTCLIGYHVMLYAFTLTGKTKTQLSMNLKNAIKWVRKRRDMTDAPTATLAIQTMRNTILVAVFIGGSTLSTAISFTNDYNNHIGEPIEQARIIIMSSLFMLSFLSWATVIRFASHLGYLVDTFGYKPKITPPPSSPSEAIVTEAIIKESNGKQEEKEKLETKKEANKPHKDPIESAVKQCIRIVTFLLFSFSFGFRFMFMALPFAFLSMGSLGLIISTFIALLFLGFYDYGYLMVPLPSADELS